MTVDLLIARPSEQYRLGQKGKALSAIRAGIAIEPAFGQLHLMRGVILKEFSSPSAVSGLLRATALVSEDSHPHVQLGICHETAGHPRRAAGSFRRAAALSPANSETWLSLARLAYDRARLDDTIAYRQRAIATDARAETGALLGVALAASGRWHEALPLFERDLYRRHGAEAAIEPLTTFAKLGHDAEQFEHLIGIGRLPPSMVETAAIYRQIQEVLPREGNPAVILEGAARQHVASTYNRILHRDPGSAVSGSALNPRLDVEEITRTYFSTKPQVVVVDDLLTPEALSCVLRFCQESTIWYIGTYSAGYIGTQMADGFAAPILFQIAEELKSRLSAIIGDAGLHHLWAFKYDSRFSGIALHADSALINVNFWVTPDDANLDPASGGLEVFDAAAPPDWDFATYNANPDKARHYLEQVGSRSLVIPHRQNRAVIFHSDLFHRTGDIHFREGYLNRRINITMLYGVRPKAVTS